MRSERRVVLACLRRLAIRLVNAQAQVGRSVIAGFLPTRQPELLAIYCDAALVCGMLRCCRLDCAEGAGADLYVSHWSLLSFVVVLVCMCRRRNFSAKNAR